MKKQRIHSSIYLFGLALLAFFIPLSESVPKIIVLILLLNSIIEFNFKQKWMLLKENKIFLLITLLFFIPVLFLINTENFYIGKYILFNKLPLLILPVIIFSSEKLTGKKLNIILLLAICGSVVSSCLGFLAFKQLILNVANDDVRRMSPFIDRITFSLIIGINIFTIIYWLKNKVIKNKFLTVLSVIIMAWFLFYLIKSEAFTGLFGILIVLVAGIVCFLFKKNSKTSKMPVLLKVFILSAIPVIMIIFSGISIYNYYTPTTLQNVSKYTKQGNVLNSYYENKQRANGNFVYWDICEKELWENWGKYSNCNLFRVVNGDTIFERTKHGELYGALLFYLTSKGLQKDAEGLSKLTSEDIKNIENGEANYKFVGKSGLSRRLYVIIDEFDRYYHSGDPNGKSLIQRVEYNRIGWQLFKDHFWFGCGTGDMSNVFIQYYASGKSKLLAHNQFLTHNQFLSFFICYGIFGGLICCLIWFLPLFFKKAFKNYFFIVFFIIATIALFSNEMLETSTRVLFVSFYYVLFLK